ncbi:hypothetical protein U1Q18_049606 [Sarracenia purpurea var. burkii]
MDQAGKEVKMDIQGTFKPWDLWPLLLVLHCVNVVGSPVVCSNWVQYEQPYAEAYDSVDSTVPQQEQAQSSAYENVVQMETEDISTSGMVTSSATSAATASGPSYIGATADQRSQDPAVRLPPGLYPTQYLPIVRTTTDAGAGMHRQMQTYQHQAAVDQTVRHQSMNIGMQQWYPLRQPPAGALPAPVAVRFPTAVTSQVYVSQFTTPPVVITQPQLREANTRLFVRQRNQWISNWGTAHSTVYANRIWSFSSPGCATGGYIQVLGRNLTDQNFYYSYLSEFEQHYQNIQRPAELITTSDRCREWRLTASHERAFGRDLLTMLTNRRPDAEEHDAEGRDAEER